MEPSFECFTWKSLNSKWEQVMQKVTDGYLEMVPVCQRIQTITLGLSLCGHIVNALIVNPISIDWMNSAAI